MRLEDAQAYGTETAARRAVATLMRPETAKGHDHHGRLESVREADHQGHHIVITTKYTIEVDAKPVRTPLHVTNDGQVRCHALPNYSFDSAVDLVKQLIDAFPEDFTANRQPAAEGGHDHSAHDHDGHGAHLVRTSDPAGQSAAARKKSPSSPW